MSADPTEAGLIARVLAEDDRGAFATLVNRHQGAVRGLLGRLCGGDRALADDLSQETFVRVYRGLATFRGGAQFATWLHRVAYNVFLSRAGRREALPVGVGDEARAHQPRAVGSEAALLRYDLERAMQALKPAEAAAVTLSYAHQLSHQEIAEVLGCPVGTVKTHIARGKERLRGELEDWQTRSGEAS